jgi:hypothetical protein
MSYQSDRRFYISLVKIFVILAFIGIAVLVYTSYTTDLADIAFSLIAFMISVAALVMTTLQSLSISRQVRITERAMELMRETDNQLEKLADEERKLSREIRQDLALDRKIVEVLEEVGVGSSADDRREVARKIAERVQVK